MSEKTLRELEADPIYMAKELAEEHWKFLERWLHIIYVDSFVHGYKHGTQDSTVGRK